MLDTINVLWGNDSVYPHLWLPDVVVYACGQALAKADPDRLRRLAHRLGIEPMDAPSNPSSGPGNQFD
jgi:hypothetical protein